MSKEFVAAARFPLHIIRTNDARWKRGGGHAIEISHPDASEDCDARLILKTTTGRKRYLYKDAIIGMFRSVGSTDTIVDDDEKYRMDWQRFPILLAGILLSACLYFMTGSAYSLLILIPVLLLMFTRHVRAVVELENGNDCTFIVCYLPASCYYRLYRSGLLGAV